MTDPKLRTPILSESVKDQLEAALPDAMIASLQAGCDAVLLCNSTLDEQLVALEAVIHAVEKGVLPLARVEDAMMRQRRVKTQFAHLMLPTASDLTPIGRDAHHAIAARMAAFL